MSVIFKVIMVTLIVIIMIIINKIIKINLWLTVPKGAKPVN